MLLDAGGGFDSGGRLQQRLGRIPIGLAGLAVLWQGLGAPLPGGEDLVPLVLRYLRCALVGAWVGGIAPLLFVRLGLADAARRPGDPRAAGHPHGA